MRVTNNMLTQNLLKNLEYANNRMDVIQNRLSSGHAITKPSDDPIRISISLRIKSTISSMEQWKTNSSEGLAYLETTEGILGNMTEMLQRVRELAVQGANGSNSVNDRKHIAQEVYQLTEQFKVLANSQVGSRFIFSGTNIDKAPLPDSGTFQWEGNQKPFSFEVGANTNIPVSVNSFELFGISADGTDSRFFNTLDKLFNGLDNSNQAQIDESLKEIDSEIDNLLAIRAELGAKTNRMHIVSDQLDSNVINLRNNLSDIQDADIAETIMEFQSVQNVYRAALSVGSQIIQPSLVDFMR